MKAVLDHYWPSVPNVEACIRTEAETVDDAVLLAVHEPGPLLVRSANGVVQEPATEQHLLDALLKPADDGSAVVVAITGESGVGKSHMVRWLHAQLQRHITREHLVIVLVPKTASLRQVVERILEPLEGLTQYKELKLALATAVEALEPGAASQMLATALAIELERKYNEGMQSLKQAGNLADRETKARLDLTRVLREILRDSDVFDKWFGAVLQRIVRQTVEGGSEAQTGELRRFVPDDLRVPDDWSPTHAKQATASALHQLMKDEGARRPLAADILQEALDPALRAVFRFSEALGQKTIEEIVDEIRRKLLDDKKELVLLIEDFAALAGIQQPLLNLMIAESDHMGKRIRAPLRTALAVTDGFLPSRQTILTRAKREWIIPNSAHTEEKVVQRLTDLAGRYLNAARWGTKSLQDQFKTVDTDLYGWVQPFEEPLPADEADFLRAFGKTRHGHHLFPLSEVAIASLCRRELKSPTGIRFNPRDFINNVLRDTVLKRPLHEGRAFPPIAFKEAVVPSAVELALRIKPWPTDQKQRLAPVLVYWAGNPADLSAPPTISKGVFEAFGLPWPFSADAPPAPPKERKQKPAEKDYVPPPTPTPTPALDYIEAWATGNIAQKQALNVRQLLATALNDRLDWNQARIRSLSVSPTQIWLPFAPIGNPTTEPKFVAADAVRPLCATLRGGLHALERWNQHGKSWDFERSEDYYAVAQQLLDRIEQQVLTWHLVQAERQAASASRTLHRQALLLRLTKAGEPSLPRLKEYFSALPRPVTQPIAGDSTPAGVVSGAMARAEAARSETQRALVDAVGCFQGVTGRSAHAIDPQRLKQAWRSELSDDAATYIKHELSQARHSAEELLTSRLNVLLNRFRGAVEGLVPSVKSLVGTEADASLIAPLRQQLARIQQAGLFPTQVCASLEADRAVDLLGSEDAKSLMRHSVSFSSPDATRSVDMQLAGWATLDIEMLSQVHTALSLLERVLKEAQRSAAAQLEALGGGDVSAMLASLLEGLGEVSEDTA